MPTHRQLATTLKAQIHEAFTSLKPEHVRVEELAGLSILDVSFPAYHAAKEWANIMVFAEQGVVRYGFSVVDKDTVYGNNPDCEFGHAPTMLKYMKRCFPLQG